MENGVEAFKIAAGMLIFVLAISITISAFTSATQALNRIFDMQNGDKYVTMTETKIDPATNQEVEVEYFLNFVRFDGGTREVGVETIVPSIYRAYRENYSIYFFHYVTDGTDKKIEPLVLYKNNKNEDVNYIDLEKEVYASAEKAEEAVNDLLYVNKETRESKCILDDEGLYKYLSSKTFTEKLGEYYMDDLSGSADTAEVNKTKKRVIVYIENQ